MTTRSPRTFRAFRIAAAILALSGTALVGTAAAAGAMMGCGEYSFGFDGTRLLNDGISDSAGPFTIELPAGTYDILMQSHDAHDEHPGQVEQTQEQWYFTLDSGYSSPTSVDIADDHNMSITEFDGVAIAASTSITVNHLGEGGVNSVDVVCVGFTASKPEELAEPEIEIAGPLLPPKEAEVVVVEAPVTRAPVVVEVLPAVKEVVEVAPPAVVEVPVEVKGQVELPATQLAVTGRTTQAALGFVLLSIALGTLLIGLSNAERKVLN